MRPQQHCFPLSIHARVSASLLCKAACALSLPEEDVSGLAAGVGVHQLLLQVLQGAVVDIDWTPQLRTLTGTLLRDLSVVIDVKVSLQRH